LPHTCFFFDIQLSSPYGAFRLTNSDVHFLHTFRPKNKPGSGWIAKEMFQEAYEEDCIVTNLAPLAASEDEDSNELVTFDSILGQEFRLTVNENSM
jgi:hypothetical protein